MLKNYFTIAWRQMLKNKLYASINTLGLVVGLSVYIFGSLLVSYERSHDLFYKNSDRIYTAGTIFGPTANIGVGETDGIYTAFAPFIDAEIEEVEEIARTVGAEFLISVGDAHFYQKIRFADPSFLKIFDFKYLEGDERALTDPSGVLLSRELAKKFFGDEPALGKVLTLDHDVSLHVAAVVEELPANTHFTSSLFSNGGIEVVAPLQALNRASDYDMAGNFNNLSSGDYTYMLLASDKDKAWLQQSLDGIYDRHYPEDGRHFVDGVKVRPLVEANTLIWDAVGLPVLDTLRLLGFLVLVVAIVNYTNLATAQSLGRHREIGLRKTMGASQSQLVTQFLVESLCVATLAMVISMAVLEIALPVFNTSLDKALQLNYFELLPWFVLTTVGVGLVAGAYPAYLITRASPIDALRDSGTKGARGGLFRSSMLVLQFSISIFMLAMVLVMFLQNQKIEESSDIYPKSQIIALKRLDVESIQSRLETLRNELLNIEGVESVAYSSQLPFQQSNSAMKVSLAKGDEDQSILLTKVIIDEHFRATYDVPLLAGRELSNEIGGDTVREGVFAANVILNELAVQQLGFVSPEQAINQVYYDIADGREPRTYTVVGVSPDRNFQGFHNQVKPMVYYMAPAALRFGSVRVNGAGMAATLEKIEVVWDDLIQDYPIQSAFLEDDFQESFEIYQGLSSVVGGFAFVAMSLSMIGLFGLAAFMTQTRTKEIGVRKIMGASVWQIVRLLIWQFSKPVMWALLIALPAAYFASGMFLRFFADRISMTEGIVLGAGVVAVLFAWIIVGIHALRIARANPIQSLRYE
jgi:putative ABC transport system permease protein